LLIRLLAPTTRIDSLLMRLWPSTQENDAVETYAETIGKLYAAYNVPLTGAIATLVVHGAASFYDSEGLLLKLLMFAYLPAFAVRYAVTAGYWRVMQHRAITEPHRDEARYAAVSMLATVAMSAVIAYSMFMLHPDARMGVALGLVAMLGISAVRTSHSPRLTVIQTYFVLVPVILGLLAFGSPLHVTLAVCVSIFLYFMHHATISFKDNFVEAIRQARVANRIANFDTVTELPNRYMLTQRLKAMIARERNDFSILAIDLDMFKQVNDSRGHQAGDELLKLAADRLTACSQSYDPDALVGRFGGDEFVIIVQQEPEQIASHIIEAFREHFPLTSGPVIIGASIGICRNFQGSTSASLLQKADTALYAAKEAGRNRFKAFTPDMEQRANDRDKMEQKFRRALANKDLTVAYQPIVTIDDGKPIAVEALARWTDQEYGFVPPPKFIGIAEQTGQIEALFSCLLEKACTEAMSWPSHIRLAFNVSPSQFLNPEGLVATVTDVLERTGLQPSRLELEITESVMIQDFQALRATLQRIQALGVKIALDDFGSGYCSLSYLHQIGFNKIKVDRSLALAAVAEKTQAIVISMIVRLADALSAQVVVEGIEDEQTALYMRSLGVRTAQGYFYGRPMPAADIAKLLSPPPAQDVSAVA